MTQNPFLSDKPPVCPDTLLKLAADMPPATIAIVRAGSPLPMQAAKQAYDAGIMHPVFIGERDAIETEAETLSWNISEFRLLETYGEEESAAAGALLGSTGEVDVVMKGQLHTDTFMSALVRKTGGITTSERLVHLFHISEPVTGKALIVSDAAVNISPSVETRKSAVRFIDQLARATGIIRPKIAFLSATETPNKAISSSIDAVELVSWARENVKTSDFSGPLALDLILSGAAVAAKGITGDPVAGDADGIIVPDIVSGNTLFKALVYLSGGCAAGIVMGGKVPVLLTSRADPPAARLASMALACILKS